MAKQVQRSTIWFVTTMALLVVLVLGTYISRVSADKRARTHKEDLVDCRSMAAQINRLRTVKQRALLKTKPADELNRKIASWAGLAEIQADRLVRIEPREPRRIGDTDYLEQVSELEIMQTELPKLIKLAQTAERSEDGLKVSAMRLSLPRSEVGREGIELWNVELTLTYLIYSPTSKRP